MARNSNGSYALWLLANTKQNFEICIYRWLDNYSADVESDIAIAYGIYLISLENF